MAVRVAGFVDGFNLYHSVDDSGLDHLKWLNLWTLCEQFAPAPQYDLTAVYYFSAYATWLQGAYARHRAYVAALKSAGVTPIMGRFKEKPRRCKYCHRQWLDHEEKESDVNLALKIVEAAYNNDYDLGLVLTGDSDIAPAVRLVRRQFPPKAIRIITSLNRPYSSELVAAAGEPARKLKRIHLERSLFSEDVLDATGTIVARRPAKYAPSL